MGHLWGDCDLSHGVSRLWADSFTSPDPSDKNTSQDWSGELSRKGDKYK